MEFTGNNKAAGNNNRPKQEPRILPLSVIQFTCVTQFMRARNALQTESRSLQTVNKGDIVSREARFDGARERDIVGE